MNVTVPFTWIEALLGCQSGSKGMGEGGRLRVAIMYLFKTRGRSLIKCFIQNREYGSRLLSSHKSRKMCSTSKIQANAIKRRIDYPAKPKISISRESRSGRSTD